MKRRSTKQVEPRTELIGLNLTDAELAQLDELFAAQKAGSPRPRKRRPITRSTVAYRCFQVGLAHRLQGKPNPLRDPDSPLTWDDLRNRPKRDAKLVGIYLTQTDFKNLMKLDWLIQRAFWGRYWLGGKNHRPFEYNKPTFLTYGCFQRGLSLLLKQLPSNRNNGVGSPQTNAE